MTTHWRHRMPKAVALTLLLLSEVAGAASGAADAGCGVLVSCEFESPGFAIRVVDDETGEPLRDAHAVAVWVAYGQFGRRAPLMALEALSGPDGTLTFPGWGPRRGPDSGLEPARDPAVTIFRPGYRVLLLYNATPPGQPHTARVRPFLQAGSTFKLAPFRGTVVEAITEFRKAAYPLIGVGPSQYDPAAIRRVYVNRWRRVRAEAEKLPRDAREVVELFERLDTSISLFSERGGS